MLVSCFSLYRLRGSLGELSEWFATCYKCYCNGIKAMRIINSDLVLSEVHLFIFNVQFEKLRISEIFGFLVLKFVLEVAYNLIICFPSCPP